MDEILFTIANSLKRLQTEGGSGNFVVLTADADRNYYVQFAVACGETELYAEAVGNEFLAPAHALRPDQVARLQSMGWCPPAGSPNFSREWQAVDDGDRLAVAREVMRVFAEVYGVEPHQPLQVELVLE